MLEIRGRAWEAMMQTDRERSCSPGGKRVLESAVAGGEERALVITTKRPCANLFISKA